MKQQITHLALSWVILIAFLTLSQPSKLPVIALVLPFLLIFWSFFQTWSFFSYLHGKFINRGGSGRHGSLGLIVGGSAVLFLILQSLGQLTLRDVVTVLALVVIGYIYVIKYKAELMHGVNNLLH